MKTEIKDVAVGLAAHSPGATGYLLTGQTIIMALTIVLLLVQIGYYMRKWVREETVLGRRICRWLSRWKWGCWLCSLGRGHE